ncbi:MAG: proprotein convertase P-domain-containing protein [Planctomycetes bacterium]|nr:proprotein convertase P-domain-containing protein [Planctomycetota bacterium]
MFSAAPIANAPACFTIEACSTPPFDLSVGPYGQEPTCTVCPAGCTVNPTIVEVIESGLDCNGNGVDDAIDIAVCQGNPACNDCNGNGIPDECDLGGTESLSPNIGIPDCPADGLSDPSAVSTIVVTDGGIVNDLKVSLQIEHTWVGDLLVTLRHDDTGTEVALMSRIGLAEVAPLCTDNECCGCGEDNVDCIFDDAAISDIENECPPVGGVSLRPNAGSSGLASALSTFNGESAAGSWTLSVFDGANLDTGTLVEWSLISDNDANGDGIPDDCVIESPAPAPAPHDILKNRYISIDPRGAGQTNPSSLHIRVEIDSTQVTGLTGSGPWWATAPVDGAGLSPATCISVVTTTKPVSEPDWTGCPVVHLTGCPIVPTTTYAIAAESGGDLSADALFDTQVKPGVKWHGDVVGFFDGIAGKWTAPQGAVNIDDAVAGIKTFQNPSAFNATHLSVTDVHPNLNGDQINLIVNIGDVFVIILGFQGQEYPGPDLTQCP